MPSHEFGDIDVVAEVGGDGAFAFWEEDAVVEVLVELFDGFGDAVEGGAVADVGGAVAEDTDDKEGFIGPTSGSAVVDFALRVGEDFMDGCADAFDAVLWGIGGLGLNLHLGFESIQYPVGRVEQGCRQGVGIVGFVLVFLS